MNEEVATKVYRGVVIALSIAILVVGGIVAFKFFNVGGAMGMNPDDPTMGQALGPGADMTMPASMTSGQAAA